MIPPGITHTGRGIFTRLANEDATRPKVSCADGIAGRLGICALRHLGYSVLRSAAKDDTSPVRAAAAEKLIRDPDSKTSDALNVGRGDEKWILRAAVINAIAQRGEGPSRRAQLWRK